MASPNLHLLQAAGYNRDGYLLIYNRCQQHSMAKINSVLKRTCAMLSTYALIWCSSSHMVKGLDKIDNTFDRIRWFWVKIQPEPSKAADTKLAGRPTGLEASAGRSGRARRQSGVVVFYVRYVMKNQCLCSRTKCLNSDDNNFLIQFLKSVSKHRSLKIIT